MSIEFNHISELQPVALLQALHQERIKFTESNKEYMAALVDKLVELGIYPAHGFNGRYQTLQMVECYGVDWHQFSGPHYCPFCKTDLRDWEAGVPGKREIYVKVLDNRSESHYQCPDCEENITAAVALARAGNHKLTEEPTG
jgi:hypothetical protein